MCWVVMSYAKFLDALAVANSLYSITFAGLIKKDHAQPKVAVVSLSKLVGAGSRRSVKLPLRIDDRPPCECRKLLLTEVSSLYGIE